MRSFLIISLFAFLLIACNQNSSSQKPFTNDLVQLENEWMHAMMKRDQITLEQLVAPGFSMSGMKYIDSSVVTRSVWMYNALHDLKLDSVHFVKIKANMVNDIGIVRANLFWSGTYDEDHFADTTSLIDTWKRSDNGWQVVSRITTD